MELYTAKKNNMLAQFGMKTIKPLLEDASQPIEAYPKLELPSEEADSFWRQLTLNAGV